VGTKQHRSDGWHVAFVVGFDAPICRLYMCARYCAACLRLRCLRLRSSRRSPIFSVCYLMHVENSIYILLFNSVFSQFGLPSAALTLEYPSVSQRSMPRMVDTYMSYRLRRQAHAHTGARPLSARLFGKSIQSPFLLLWASAFSVPIRTLTRASLALASNR